MSNNINIWRELDLNPTKDTSLIRAAYKELITKYHPEEYPEKASRLNQAYREAMAWARSEHGAIEKDVEEATEVDFPQKSHGWESRGQDESEKPISEAERIGKFVEEVVWQDEFAHEQILKDTSERLDRICRPKHRQNHKEWQAFLEDSNTKEAFLSSDFAMMFANRIEKLRFWSKTVKMIRRWLSKNVPHDYYPLDFLLFANLKALDESETKKEKKLITYFVVITVFISLCFVVYLISGTSKNPSTNEITKQINEKYKVEASISEVDYDMKYDRINNYKTDDKIVYYQADAILSDGTKLTFYITWNKETDTYTDDFDYELVKTYADMFSIEIWENTKGPIALKIDEPLDEYANRLKELIDNLVETEYVQAGNTIVFMIRPDTLTIGQFPITINKDTVADEKDLIELLEEAIETANTVLLQNN